MSTGENRGLASLVNVAGLRLLLWLVLGAWFYAHILQNPYLIGEGHDWTYFTHHLIASYRTYVDYHQLPVWNPYFCGGIPGIGNVQSMAGSPTMIFPILFGALPGWRLSMLVMLVLGMEGAYQYAWHNGARSLGAIVAATCFAMSGRFVQLLYDGQPVFLGFELAPWLFVGFERGFRDLRWSVLGGLAMSVVFLEGGAVATPILTVSLAILFIVSTFSMVVTRSRDPAWWSPLRSLLVMTAVTIGTSAFRLLPVGAALLAFPRTWEGGESYTAAAVFDMLFTQNASPGYSGPGSAYVGIFCLLAAAYAVAQHDRRSLFLVAMGFLCFDLAMGEQSWLHLYAAVKHLPILQNIRNPFRFVVCTALFVSVAAGKGLWLLEERLLRWMQHPALDRLAMRFRISEPWTTRIVASAVTILIAVPAYFIASQNLKYNRDRVDRLPLHAVGLSMDRPFRQSIGNRWLAHVWPAVNLGSIACFEEQPFFTSPALRGDLPQEEYLADPSAGTVTRVAWSPTRIDLDVWLVKPATVIVNQNYHRGWIANHGSVRSIDGLLAVSVPKGRYRLVIRFVDRLVVAGGVVSVVTTSGLLGIWGVGVYRKRRRRREPGAAPGVVPASRRGERLGTHRSGPSDAGPERPSPRSSDEV